MSAADHEHDPAEHAAFAAELALGEALSGEEVADRARLLVCDLAEAAAAAGCRLIGHVKCFIRGESDDPSDHLYFSLTSLRHGATAQGALAVPARTRRLALAAIVYGIAPETLETLARRCIAQRFPQAQQL